MADLWHREQFDIVAGEFEPGVSYYAVLRCALERVEELLAEDTPFDIVIDIPELQAAQYKTLYYPLEDARERRYRYPRWMHYKGHIAIGVLLIFLGGFRAYRILRWWRRRREASCNPSAEAEGPA
jgi:hypothetical protein